MTHRLVIASEERVAELTEHELTQFGELLARGGFIDGILQSPENLLGAANIVRGAIGSGTIEPTSWSTDNYQIKRDVEDLAELHRIGEIAHKSGYGAWVHGHRNESIRQNILSVYDRSELGTFRSLVGHTNVRNHLVITSSTRAQIVILLSAWAKNRLTADTGSSALRFDYEQRGGMRLAMIRQESISV